MNVRRIKGLKPLLVKGKNLWVSDGYKILKSNDKCESFEEVGQFPISFYERLKNKNHVTSRLFRLGFHGLNELSDGSLIGIIKGKIIKLNYGESEFKSVLDIPRGSRPLNICCTPNDNLFFGEYFNNLDRQEVYIYGSYDKGETWEKVYEFPQNEIRHIHGIYYDEFRKGCWILTGDLKNECQILFTNNDFKSVTTVLKGNQMARAVSVIPLEKGLIIPSDTPQEQNFIQWLDTNSGKLEKLKPIDSSAFYAGYYGGKYLVSTVVEPSSVNKTRKATLYISDDGLNWNKFYSQTKDFLSLKYFQYGSLFLPKGSTTDNTIYAYGQGLINDDNYLIVWDL